MQILTQSIRIAQIKRFEIICVFSIKPNELLGNIYWNLNCYDKLFKVWE